MRHYMVDPDNDERLLKVPPHVVARIKEEARAESRAAILLVARSFGLAEDACIVAEFLDAVGGAPLEPAASSDVPVAAAVADAPAASDVCAWPAECETGCRSCEDWNAQEQISQQAYRSAVHQAIAVVEREWRLSRAESGEPPLLMTVKVALRALAAGEPEVPDFNVGDGHDPLCPRPACDFGQPDAYCIDLYECPHYCRCLEYARVRAHERKTQAGAR